MFNNMENIDLDIVNRQFFFETGSFLGSNNNSSGSTSAGSTNSSDLFLYDENSSDSTGSTYSFNSDQENSSYGSTSKQ